MPIVQGRGFDHITLQVKNADTSLAWYQGVFGFKPLRVEEWRRGAASYPSLRISDTCVLNLLPSPTKDGPAAGTACNMRCLAVRLDDNTDLESLLEQLAAAGVKVDKQADGIIVQRWGALGRSKSIYIRDPDSNIIEVKTYDSSMTLNLA